MVRLMTKVMAQCKWMRMRMRMMWMWMQMMMWMMLLKEMESGKLSNEAENDAQSGELRQEKLADFASKERHVLARLCDWELEWKDIATIECEDCEAQTGQQRPCREWIALDRENN